MRLSEFLTESEDDTTSVVNDLSTILTVCRKKGNATVKTEAVVKMLQMYGHDDIDVEVLQSIATQSTMVKSVTPDSIEINDGSGIDQPGESNDAEQNQEVVSNMAQDTAQDALQGN